MTRLTTGRNAEAGHCKNVIKGLHRWEQILFIAHMCSKVTLALGTALAGIALCCFVESSLAQDALTASIAESDNDDVESDDTKDDKSRRRRSHKSGSNVNTDNAPWANAGENRSLAITNVTETAEAEAVVVTGSFDIYPVPYPALPPVEGTRINAGKKTSFVKPQEFPTFAGNDYREVMATTPALLSAKSPVHQLSTSVIAV